MTSTSTMPGPAKNAATGYEKHLVQVTSIRIKFQLLGASLILALTSPFAIPMLLLKASQLDEGLSASFDTMISAAYLMTIGSVLIMVHAKNILASYDSRIHTERMDASSFIFSGPTNITGGYISAVSNASAWMNAACVATFGAGISAVLFQFYPIGTLACGTIAVAAILTDSIMSQLKQGTLLKGNTLSAVSNIRGAVSENKLGGLVPAL